MNEKEIAQVLIAAFSAYGSSGNALTDPVEELQQRFPDASQAACDFVARMRPLLMRAFEEGRSTMEKK